MRLWLILWLLQFFQAHHEFNDTCNTSQTPLLKAPLYQSGTALYEPPMQNGGFASIPDTRQYALITKEIAPSKMALIPYFNEKKKRELIDIKKIQKNDQKRHQRTSNKIRTNSLFRKCY